MLESIWSENWLWLMGYLVNLGRIILFAAGILLCIGILHRLSKKNEGMCLVVLGLFLFLAEYVIISAVLFQVDKWGITTTLLIEAVIDGGLYGWLVSRDRKRELSGRIRFSLKSYWPMLCLCLAAALMAQNYNGYYGMQQDQGVYQTAAVAMVTGNWENVAELDVYQNLEKEDRERYMHVVPTEINGFYFYEQSLEGLYSIDFTADTIGYFHGIPTYPALLALWGGMFGINRMGGIQTMLYVLLLALGYMLLSELRCRKSLMLLGCGIIAVSPMVLWTAQSALTEIYLACALTAFLYFLTQEGKWAVWLSAIMITSFGCIHLSVYILMPIVVLIYAGLYIRYKERTYIGAGVLVVVCFWFVVNLTRIISTKYFYINISPLTDLLPWLDQENVMGFITMVCMTVVIAGLIMLLTYSEKRQINRKTRARKAGVGKASARDKESKGSIGDKRAGSRQHTRQIKRFMVYEWSVRILVVLWCVMTIKSVIDLGFQGGEEGQVTACVIGYCLLAGVGILPIGLAGILVKPRLLWKDRASALLGALFVYCIMIYSMAFRREIGYYYYYGRYLVPFIPLVVWQGIQALQLLKGKAGMVACGIVAALQIILLPYDLVLMAQRDDTRMSWEALEQVSKRVGAEDVLIIEDSLLSTCYLPLTYLVQGDVLPQMQYPPGEVMERYASKKGQTYYLSSGRSGIGGTYTVLRIGYMTSEDEQKGDRGVLGLPLRMASNMQYLQLDRMLQEKYAYTAEDDCWINMFMDEKGFRWGYGGEYGLSVCLEKGDYWVTVSMGEAVPLEIYGVEFYPIHVYVNGLYLQELRIYQGNEEADIVFEVPAAYLKEGENDILFRSEPWKPKDFGKEDYREMGVNIRRVQFWAE